MVTILSSALVSELILSTAAQTPNTAPRLAQSHAGFYRACARLPGRAAVFPERNVIDRAGVRHDWSGFFSTMPDFWVEILSTASEGNIVWAELFFQGTRADGTEQMMQGVNIAEIQAEQIVSGKLYQNTVKNFSKTTMKEGLPQIVKIKTDRFGR